MKQIFTLAIFLSILLVGCGDGTMDGLQDPQFNNVIKNTIKENTIPVGLSSFAMGVVGKFPLEDTQTPEGVGYKSVARVVRHIATNELYTFPETSNELQVEETIKFFLDNGHAVTHEIFILNGPSMRKCRDPWINGVLGKKVCDEEFVRSLQHDPMTRAAVQSLFNKVVVYAKRLEALGATVLICPELEDNQTHSTFKILLEFLNKAGWRDSSKIVRNGGSPGEFGNVRFETHDDTAISKLRPGDIVNNDGNSFVFYDEKPNSGEIPENRIRYMLEHAESLGVIAFLWNTRLQGNVQASPGNFIPYPSYTDRTYVLKRPAAQAAILLGINETEVIVETPIQ